MENNRKNILVIGGSGFVGGRIVQALADKRRDVVYTYATHKIPLDIHAYPLRITPTSGALKSILADINPHIVIYCAVNYGDETTQRLINIEGVKRTISHLPSDALFIYLSTNAVFGNGRGAYREDETPDAHLRTDSYRIYGTTKAEGERITREHWANSIIIRTDTVNGRDVWGRFNPRLESQIQQLKQGEIVSRFVDRYISPTLVDNLAEAIAEICEPDFQYRGVLHIAGSERITDYEYARILARHIGADENLVHAQHIADTPMKNAPRDASLSVEFTQTLLKTRLLTVEQQMQHIK